MIPPRWIGMGIERRAAQWARRDHSRSRPRVFNLDLHTSVVADIRQGLAPEDISLTSWSLSGHNYVTRRLFTAPDPVSVVNARSWRELDVNQIDRFQDKYGRYLRSFDGFLVTHTPSFAQLFTGLGKPCLVVASTRYEAPYTARPDAWSALNTFIRQELQASRMILVANNLADAAYCEFHLGVHVKCVPSVCDYTQIVWNGDPSVKVISAMDPTLTSLIRTTLGSEWLPWDSVLHRHYRWQQLASLGEVVVVPYNISTMTLFELATAGIPVSVPSSRLLKEWFHAHSGVLSQLTWYQVEGVTPPKDEENPANSDRSDFLDWWIARADFMQRNVMPNVRIFDDVSELQVPHPWHLSSHRRELAERNSALTLGRQHLMKQFRQLL